MNYAVENILIAMVIAVVIWTLFNNWRFSAALSVSLLSGMFIPEYQPHLMIISFFICIVSGFTGGKLKFLNIEENEALYAVAFIYPFRMVVEHVGDKWTVMSEPMWILSVPVLLLLQLLLSLGGTLNGYSKRLNDSLTNIRVATHSAIFSRFGL